MVENLDLIYEGNLDVKEYHKVWAKKHIFLFSFLLFFGFSAIILVIIISILRRKDIRPMENALILLYISLGGMILLLPFYLYRTPVFYFQPVGDTKIYLNKFENYLLIEWKYKKINSAKKIYIKKKKIIDNHVYVEEKARLYAYLPIEIDQYLN